MTELKPCPLCGGAAIIDREDIFCDNCHLSCRIYDRLYNSEAEDYQEARQQAIDCWNTRAPQEEINNTPDANDKEASNWLFASIDEIIDGA